MNGRLLAMIAATIVYAWCLPAAAQQIPDRGFRPLGTPTYVDETGPIVCVDEAHHNFHTVDERFWVFCELLRRDGYMVRSVHAKFNRASLGQCAIVVISNAQPSDAPWETYTYPTRSASRQEIVATHQWVQEGGSPLLIADHMPLAGAAASLAGRIRCHLPGWICS